MYSKGNVLYFVPFYTPFSMDLRNTRKRTSPNDVVILVEFDLSFLVFNGQLGLDQGITEIKG